MKNEFQIIDGFNHDNINHIEFKEEMRIDNINTRFYKNKFYLSNSNYHGSVLTCIVPMFKYSFEKIS